MHEHVSGDGFATDVSCLFIPAVAWVTLLSSVNCSCAGQQQDGFYPAPLPPLREHKRAQESTGGINQVRHEAKLDDVQDDGMFRSSPRPQLGEVYFGSEV